MGSRDSWLTRLLGLYGGASRLAYPNTYPNFRAEAKKSETTGEEPYKGAFGVASWLSGVYNWFAGKVLGGAKNYISDFLRRLTPANLLNMFPYGKNIYAIT